MNSIHEILNSPEFWIVVAAASEILALSPLKSNSIIQLFFQVLKAAKPKNLRR